MNITPEDIAKTDISDWLNPDRTLNVEKMQEDIKNTLIKNHKRIMRWQARALRVGLVGSTPEN